MTNNEEKYLRKLESIYWLLRIEGKHTNTIKSLAEILKKAGLEF